MSVVVKAQSEGERSTTGVCTVMNDAVLISLSQVDAVGTVIIAEYQSEPSARLGDRDNTHINLLAKLVVDRFRGATKKRIVLTVALQRGREQDLANLELLAEALKRRAFEPPSLQTVAIS